MLSLPPADKWNRKLALVLLDGGVAARELNCLIARGYACCHGVLEPSLIPQSIEISTNELRTILGFGPKRTFILANASWALYALQLAAMEPRSFDCIIAQGVQDRAELANLDLAAYAESGGRLIIFHDPTQPGSSLTQAIELFGNLERRAGSLAAAAAFARLFILPTGDTPTKTGKGGWRTDWLELAEKWLEQRPPRPPDDPVLWRLKMHADPIDGLFAPGSVNPKSIAETRPVYPYPLRILYKGRGNPLEWQSWYAPGIYRRDFTPPAADELPDPIPQDKTVRHELRIDMKTGPVAIVGATGRLGIELVKALQSQSIPIKALVRDFERAATLLPPDVDREVVDVRDPEKFVKALSGTRRVIFAASATAGGSGDNTPKAVEYEAVCTLVTAARSLLLEQILLISSAACSQLEHIHNLWGDILLWKLRSEQVLRSSGVPYSILRPTGLRSYPGGQRGIRFVQGDRIALGEEISRQDVASLCVALLGDPHGLGKTFEAYNDDSLTPGAWVGTFGSVKADS